MSTPLSCPLCGGHHRARACSRSWPAPVARPPAICPVCAGRGSVPHDFYAQLGYSTNTARETCRACGGRGVL